MDFHDERMVSFDVKSLFTNVPVGKAMDAVKRASRNINDENLPILKEDYIKPVEHCVKFGAFTFEGEEYLQHKDLSMGFLLSAVMACLYMETLETNNYMRIMVGGSTWFKYVDDALIIVPMGTNISKELRMLNSFNKDI